MTFTPWTLTTSTLAPSGMTLSEVADQISLSILTLPRMLPGLTSLVTRPIRPTRESLESVIGLPGGAHRSAGWRYVLVEVEGQEEGGDERGDEDDGGPNAVGGLGERHYDGAHDGKRDTGHQYEGAWSERLGYDEDDADDEDNQPDLVDGHGEHPLVRE